MKIRRLNLLLPTSRDVRLLLLSGFLFGFGFSGFGVILNLYLKELGHREGVIGHLLSARTLAMMVMTIPAAFLVRRLRLKTALVATGLVTASASLLVIFRADMAPIAIGLILVGAVQAFPTVIRGPMIMKGTKARHQTFLFGLDLALMIASGVPGALLAGWLPDILRACEYPLVRGFRISLLVHVGIASLSMLPVLLIRTRTLIDDHREHFFHVQTSWWQIARLASPHVLVGLGAGLSIPFLNLYFTDRFDLAPSEIGALFAAMQVAMILGAVSAPRFARRWGRIRSVILFQVLSVPFLYILAVSGHLWLSIAAFLARGSLMNMAQPMVMNFSLEKTHEHDHPLMSGIMTTAWLASFGVTANIGGWLIEEYGYFWPFNLTLAAYVLSSAVYLLVILPMERE